MSHRERPQVPAGFREKVRGKVRCGTQTDVRKRARTEVSNGRPHHLRYRWEECFKIFITVHQVEKTPFDFVAVYETKVEQHCRTLSVPECDTVVVTKIESVPDKECVVVQVVIVIFKPFSVRALV